MLELRGLTRRHGDVLALDNVSFTVGEGQMFGFIGPNGAGKTTAMRIILGVLEPNGGEVQWRGRMMDDEIRRRVGYMPEDHGQTFLQQFAAYRSEPADRGDWWWRDVLAPAEWLPSRAGCVRTVRGGRGACRPRGTATSVPARMRVRPERGSASQKRSLRGASSAVTCDDRGAWLDLNLGPHPERKIPGHAARGSRVTWWPRAWSWATGPPDFHPSWRPPAMWVLSETDG